MSPSPVAPLQNLPLSAAAAEMTIDFSQVSHTYRPLTFSSEQNDPKRFPPKQKKELISRLES